MSNRDLIPDFDDTEEKKAAVTGPKLKEQIHIRYQQVSSKRSLTIIQGLPKKLDCDKVLSFFKKSLCCGGEIIAEENGTKVIQLNGDHRQKVADFFIKEKIAPKEMVIVHGT